MGMAVAAGEICMEAGLLSERVLAAFTDAVFQMYTIPRVVYDKELFQKGYAEIREETSKPTALLNSDCAEVRSLMPPQTATLQQEYAQAMATYPGAMAAENKTFSDFNKEMAQMNREAGETLRQYQTAPSNEVSFGPSETNKTRVYMEDQCSGAIVNNQCHGAVIDTGVPKYCYGTMMKGQCLGRVSY